MLSFNFYLNVMGVIEMKVLILSVDGFEDFELIYFFYRIKEEGYEVYVVSF